MLLLSSSQLSQVSQNHFRTQTSRLGNSFPKAHCGIILLPPSVLCFPGLLLKHHSNVSKCDKVISLWSHIYLAKQMAVFVVSSRYRQFLKQLLSGCNLKWVTMWKKPGDLSFARTTFSFLKFSCDSHCITPAGFPWIVLSSCCYPFRVVLSSTE